MRGIVIGIVVGMILAAVAGAGASYALGTLMPPKMPETRKQTADDNVVRTVVKEELDEFELSMSERIDEVADSVEILTSKMDRFEKSLQVLKERALVGASPAVAPGPGGLQAQSPERVDEEVVKRVLEEKDRQEREREEQRHIERQEQFSQMMQLRVDNYSVQKNWDVRKTDAVKNILAESSKKMSELFREGGRRSPEAWQNMGRLMEETRAKLAEVLTEEELNELVGEVMPFGGQRRGPGGEGQPRRGTAPAPEGR